MRHQTSVFLLVSLATITLALAWQISSIVAQSIDIVPVRMSSGEDAVERL